MERRTDGWGVMVIPGGTTKIVFQLYTMETGTVGFTSLPLYGHFVFLFINTLHVTSLFLCVK